MRVVIIYRIHLFSYRRVNIFKKIVQRNKIYTNRYEICGPIFINLFVIRREWNKGEGRVSYCMEAPFMNQPVSSPFLAV